MKSKALYSLRIKVISGFAVVLAILIAVIFFSYVQIKRLFQSLEYLSKPDSQEQVLNDMYQNTHYSIKDIQLYSLTGDTRHFEQYLSRTSRLKSQLDWLRTKDSFTPFIAELDSLNRLLDMKDTLAVCLKQCMAKQDSSYKSFRNIKVRTDTIYYPAIAVETIWVAPAAKQREKRGFWRRMFPGKEKESGIRSPVGPLLSDPAVPDYRLDTVIEVNAIPYSDVGKIKQELNAWEYKDKEIRNLITREEKDLLKNSDAIVHLIRQVLDELRLDGRMRTEDNLQEAGIVVREATWTILFSGLTGLAGCIVFFLLIAKDIQLSHRYKMQLTDEKQRAEQLAAVKEQFLSNMSHEIRTPLSAIIGFSEQLDRAMLHPEQRRYVAAIRTSSDHLLSLVNDILDLSKIEAGKMVVERRSFKLSDVAKEVYENLKIKAEEKELQFVSQVDVALDKKVLGDPFRLKQILFNLVGNAIKFTEEGSVTLSFSLLSSGNEGCEVQIEVQDTGIGIAGDKLETVFNSFEQGSASDSRKFGGTGLGLSISRNLTGLMGGTISVESELHKGTIFKVIIPFDYDLQEEEEVLIKEKKTHMYNFKDKDILVVEDDPFITDLMAVLFGKQGAKVRFVKCGEDGYREFVRQCPDLMITDMHLPDLTGIALIEKIRKEHTGAKQAVPLLLCTANVLDAQKYKTFENVYFLNKPFKEEALWEAIGVALGAMQSSPVNDTVAAELQKEEKFSVSQLRSIMGDEKEWQQMVEKIIFHGKEAIGHFDEALQHGDLKRVGKVAHKLIPTYTLLEASEIVSRLAILENHAQNDPLEEVKAQVQSLVVLLTEVLNALELNYLNSEV